MRILFIGNGNRKSHGLRHLSYDTRIFNGLVRNNHCVYFFSDRDEVRQSSPLRVLKEIGKKRANEKLLKIVANFRPEAIVLTHVDTILPETFEEIRRLIPYIRIAQVYIDALFNPFNYKKMTQRKYAVDATFITTGGDVLSEIAGENGTAYFIPNFVDSSIETGKAHTHETLPFDIACFMNADTGLDADEVARLNIANGLTEKIKGLKTCYGGFNGLPSLRGVDYGSRLSQSAMGLNLSKFVSGGQASTPRNRYLYSSDRIAHFFGNGCLTLIQNGFFLDEIYTRDEAVFFDGLDDLAEQVSFFIKNQNLRQTIAYNGWKKAHNCHNSTIVMQYAIEQLFNTPLSQTYEWPTQGYKKQRASIQTAGRG